MEASKPILKTMHDNRQSIWQSTDRHTQKRSQTFSCIVNDVHQELGTRKGDICVVFLCLLSFLSFFVPSFSLSFLFFLLPKLCLASRLTHFLSPIVHTQTGENKFQRQSTKNNTTAPPLLLFLCFFSPHPSSRQPIEALEKPESTLSALLKKDKDNASYTQRLKGRIRLFFSLFVFHRWRVLSLSAPEKKLFKKNVSLIKDSRPLSKKHNFTLLRSHVIQF